MKSTRENLTNLNPLEIIQKYYDPSSKLYEVLIVHSVNVTYKARELSHRYLEKHPSESVDIPFLTEAALLHDIGIYLCDAKDIHCTGKNPYLLHGTLGREILENESLPRHALVCERHTGAGISMQEVEKWNLPLPKRDYLPVSIEEKIICVADKFYSKTSDKIWQAKSIDTVQKSIAKWGDEALARWKDLFQEVTD